MDCFKYKGLIYVKAGGGGWKITAVKLTDFESDRSGRIYFWPNKENVIENMRDRGLRPHQVWRKMLPIVLEKAKKDAKLAESAKWSQNAGCSCGCSPGFIVPDLDQDISVSVG
jgi:hypothetical protein